VTEPVRFLDFRRPTQTPTRWRRCSAYRTGLRMRSTMSSRPLRRSMAGEHASVSLTTVELEPDGDGTLLAFTE
jgi:hypothetical protein